MRQLSSALVRNLIFPIWNLRDHPHFSRYFREFQRTQFLSRDEIEQLQLRRLRELLKHAYANCPFYRARMDQAGLSPEVHSLTDLRNLPPLTKRDIQDNAAEMLARNVPESARLRNQTGGSTGSPLQFYVDRERFDSREASTVRHNLWVGMRPGDWQAVLWGARLDQLPQDRLWDRLRNNWLYRKLELNTSSIRPDDWTAYIDRLRRVRPRFMVTYAQSAVLFARELQERGIGDIAFDAIITTSEVLLPGQRTLLEQTFRTRIFDRYGCREMSVIASECEAHTGLHVNAEALLVEIAAEADGGAGKILVTDLLNRSMPLIRYEIGDVGSWAASQKCPCGRSLPLLNPIEGRTTDFLVLGDGRRISGPALTLVIADMSDVRQVQIVQTGPQSITMRVVPGRGYGPDTEKELERRFGLYLQGAAALRVETVESIASELSGKYRFVINEMTPAAESR